jgi:hypothetical protein
MKNLTDILIESKKTYSFKIGVAGELPENFAEKLKTFLEKFTVSSISSGKKTPIQERPMDFPQLENTEVTYWDVNLTYPTTDGVLREYLGQVCGVHPSKIVVRNPNGPVEEQNGTTTEIYEPLLTKEELNGESAQKDVAQSRIMDLLKELEKTRKERNDNNDGFKVEAIKEEPQNTKSAIGS